MFRFSIRELMLVTLVVALGVGWVVDHWRPTNQFLKMEMRSLAMERALEQLGCEVLQEGWKCEVYRKGEPLSTITGDFPWLDETQAAVLRESSP